jgi:CHASE3 domain sensor protein
MKIFFQNNWIVFAVGAALMLSTIMAVRNKSTIEHNSALQQQSVQVKLLAEQILSKTIHGLDLGLRGFALTKDEQMLIPYREAITENEQIFRSLQEMLTMQRYNHSDELATVRDEVNKYITLCNTTVERIKGDSTNDFVLQLLKEDRGYAVWKKYNDFTVALFEFEDELYRNAVEGYQTAIMRNLILQIAIALLVLPAILVFVVKIRKEREARQQLLVEVEQNDQKFMFDPGRKTSFDTNAVLNTSIKNARAAAEFVKSISRGDYNVDWVGLNSENSNLNADTLAGYLVGMRERMKEVKIQDDQRYWSNQGLTSFSELVRNHQTSIKELADHCVSFLSKYLKAQQCSLFTLTETDSDPYLELTACYAFDKKKWLEKRIGVGEGLLGQAYLEGDVVQLKELPPGYTKITSGLGDATPKHLVLVPLKYDTQIAGVIEMASFQVFAEHEINFLAKAGEYLASALINTRTNRQMQQLLEDAKINEANMRQREEEMRQNMEELQAIQEEMVRKEKETQKQLEKAALN